PRPPGPLPGPPILASLHPNPRAPARGDALSEALSFPAPWAPAHASAASPARTLAAHAQPLRECFVPFSLLFVTGRSTTICSSATLEGSVSYPCICLSPSIDVRKLTRLLCPNRALHAWARGSEPSDTHPSSQLSPS